MEAYERDQLRSIANYQFGRGAGLALFPSGDDTEIRRSASGRVRQVRVDEKHLVSVGTDGRLTLGTVGGRRIVHELDHPHARVVVGDESAPYVRDGRSVFAKFVRNTDGSIRPKDEVAVVHHDGTFLGVGRAELDATSMQTFDRGVAVSVRSGADPEGSGVQRGEASP